MIAGNQPHVRFASYYRRMNSESGRRIDSRCFIVSVSYAFFFPATALIMNKVPSIRTSVTGRHTYHFGTKPAMM